VRNLRNTNIDCNVSGSISMTRINLPLALWLLCSTLLFAQAENAESSSKNVPTTAPVSPWVSDYTAAYNRAKQEGKMLFIWFINDQPTACDQAFWQNVLLNAQIAQKLQEKYICIQLHLSTQVDFGQGPFTIAGHSSFTHMQRQSGIAVIDLANANSPYYGQVVSAFGAGCGKPLDITKTNVVLDLPPGSLTQRTLVYAVRMHPESPQSTWGSFDPMLASEAAKHAQHQANIRLQGHHQWEQRFQSISAQLGGGLHAQEVCAESWPGQNLIEAAEECVSSWRQSSGHWSAVRAMQPRYGYDMKLGSNGIWYGTGIFGNNH
jgi:hypothetical protein